MAPERREESPTHRGLVVSRAASRTWHRLLIKLRVSCISSCICIYSSPTLQPCKTNLKIGAEKGIPKWTAVKSSFRAAKTGVLSNQRLWTKNQISFFSTFAFRMRSGGKPTTESCFFVCPSEVIQVIWALQMSHLRDPCWFHALVVLCSSMSACVCACVCNCVFLCMALCGLLSHPCVCACACVRACGPSCGPLSPCGVGGPAHPPTHPTRA